MTAAAHGQHFAALVTPFDDDGRVDEATFRRICDRMCSTDGLAGLVVNANAGEVDALTQDERRRLVTIAATSAHEAKMSLIAGLAPVPSSFRGASENAKEFRDEGADGLLVLGPTGFGRGIGHDPTLVGDYLAQIWDSSQLPITYFLAGRLSGIEYTPAVIAEICKADAVVALKDTMWTTEGFAATKAIADSVAPHIQVLTGNDNCVLTTLVAGAAGTLLVLNMLVGREVIEMDRALRANNVGAAREIDVRIRPLVDLLFRPPMLKMASRIKAAMWLTGQLPNKGTRLPVPELSTTEVSELKLALHAAGLA